MEPFRMKSRRAVLHCGSTEVRYGYTLDDLNRAAGHAVYSAFAQAADYVERFEAAWLGIAERLAEASERPTFGQLVWAGQQAVNQVVRAYRHDHGLPVDGVSDPTGFRVTFQRYWNFTMRHTPGHDNNVVERQAVAQILAQLTPRQQQALTALAATGDYAAAAKMLGLGYQSYHTVLRKARIRFLELWHEGEAPSALWGRDRRIWRRDVTEVTDHRSALVRRRASWNRQKRNQATQ